MLEALKHTLYAGLGATVITAEKMEAALNELVEKGKLTSEEARETARKIAEESKKDFRDAQKSLESMFEEMLDKSPVVRKKEFEKLSKRLDALEKKIDKLNKPES